MFEREFEPFFLEDYDFDEPFDPMSLNLSEEDDEDDWEEEWD